MTPGTGPGDLARRVRERRLELGLSYEEVARRAGMAPGYVEYLEGTVPVLGIGSLVRLAAALETTAAHLGGADIDRSPGRGGPGRAPQLTELDAAESATRLEGGGIGRIVFTDEQGPTAVPVSFKLLDGDVVFRSSEESTIGRVLAAAPLPVSFEVDHIDDALHEGWSVLVHGRAHRITDGQELEQARALAIEPWSGVERNLYVRVRAASLTGRRIRARAA
jgi:nitroimidazol reductase NimA-like FMN-containing flavoprotein (pyridoxamine 5'-phosphate oxidase superfamily)